MVSERCCLIVQVREISARDGRGSEEKRFLETTMGALHKQKIKGVSQSETIKGNIHILPAGQNHRLPAAKT